MYAQWLSRYEQRINQDFREVIFFRSSFKVLANNLALGAAHSILGSLAASSTGRILLYLLGKFNPLFFGLFHRTIVTVRNEDEEEEEGKS